MIKIKFFFLGEDYLVALSFNRSTALSLPTSSLSPPFRCLASKEYKQQNGSVINYLCVAESLCGATSV